jgi:hypothetical protein
MITTYSFTLHVVGRDTEQDNYEDVFYGAGCDYALISAEMAFYSSISIGKSGPISWPLDRRSAILSWGAARWLR